MSVNRRKDQAIDRSNDGTRRRTRSLSPLPTSRIQDDTPAQKRPCASIRKFTSEIKYCCDLEEIPHSFKCGGCSRWDESKKLKPRDEIKTREYQCLRIWKTPANKVDNHYFKHCNAIMGYIETACDIHRSSLAEEHSSSDDGSTKEPTPEPTTTTTTTNNAPAAKEKRKINYLPNDFWVEGEKFTIMVPSTHKIEHRSDIKRWQNGHDTCTAIRKKLQCKQCYTNSLFVQTLWSLAMSSVPALALSAAQHVTPLIVHAFLHDTGLFQVSKVGEDNVKIAKFATSFPSDATLRRYNENQAARDTMSLANELKDKKIYMACDKGNKKGVGHLAKVLSWLNNEGNVQTQVLDIDASGGTSTLCAQAMQASMNKLKLPGAATHLINGQCADSGGGGALDSLASELHDLPNVCVPDDDYFIGNCTTHALQLQLRNSVVDALGDGALDKVNAMQLLHTVWDLQESLDRDEWKHMLTIANEFVVAHDPTAPAMAPDEQRRAADRNKATFQAEFAKVYKYHSEFKKTPLDHTANIIGTLLQKMQAPILTWWWTVGTGCDYAFDYFLQLFFAAQIVINTCPSGSGPHGIASNLYAHMLNQENFIDITLIRCYHKGYFVKQLDWFQSCDDLSNANAFQSHNVAARFYIMDRELNGLLTIPAFKCYTEAASRSLEGETDTKKRKEENDRHMKKLTAFMKQSVESLRKHFLRWVSPSLLPAALLSEPPLAAIVAAAMLQVDCPTFESNPAVIIDAFDTTVKYYSSTAHKVRITLAPFDKFIRKHIQHDVPYPPIVLQAADAALRGIDIRAKSCSATVDHDPLRYHMHSKYLPLPHQTQFVESVVKEAKIVSVTDRSEQHRSCIATIRSGTPLGRAKEDANKKKIIGIIESARARSDPHVEWADDDGYANHITSIKTAMKADHFKHTRIEEKIAVVDSQGPKCKKPNATQQVKQQHHAPAVSGLIPFGKIFTTKTGHMKGLQVELMHRGFEVKEIPPGANARKHKLRVLETERLMADGMERSKAAAQAQKHFKLLSNAKFLFA